MFGSLTDKLAIVGACAVVFWIICWLILVSQSDRIPHWLSSLAAIVACIFAVVTALPTALFFAPIYLNFNQTYNKIKHEEFQKGLTSSLSVSSKELKDAHDKGYNEAVERYEKIIQKDRSKFNKVFVAYCGLYIKCKNDPQLLEAIRDVPAPNGFEFYEKHHIDKGDPHA